MRQFVYISMAMTSDETAIDRIVEESLRNNARDAITGFLLYNGRNFVQLVEGPAAPMLALIPGWRVINGTAASCGSRIA